MKTTLTVLFLIGFALLAGVAANATTITISGLCPAEGVSSISCSGTDIFGNSGGATFATKGLTLSGDYSLLNLSGDYQGFTYSATFDRSTAPVGTYLETLIYNGIPSSATTSIIDATKNPLQFLHVAGTGALGPHDGSFTASFTKQAPVAATPETSTAVMCLGSLAFIVFIARARAKTVDRLSQAC